MAVLERTLVRDDRTVSRLLPGKLQGERQYATLIVVTPPKLENWVVTLNWEQRTSWCNDGEVFERRRLKWEQDKRFDGKRLMRTTFPKVVAGVHFAVTIEDGGDPPQNASFKFNYERYHWDTRLEPFSVVVIDFREEDRSGEQHASVPIIE